jgi:hypothetical protein
MYLEIKATFKGSYVHVVPPLKKAIALQNANIVVMGNVFSMVQKSLSTIACLFACLIGEIFLFYF